MKKSTLFLACCIGLMLFASCKKDPIAPTISVFNGTGYVSENASIFSGDEIIVGFVGTGENLTQLDVTISQNGTKLTSHFETIEKAASYNYSHTFTFEASGTVTITGKVTDATGQTATKSFNITCNEKPNSKFLGHYEGNALATGTYQANITGMEPIQEQFTDREVPVILDLAEGENMNEVIGTCKIEDRTMTAKGTVDGDKVTFEAIDDIITINYQNIEPQIKMTYTVNGTLTNNQLLLDGTCTGTGEFNLYVISGDINLEGTVGGSLNKLH